MSKRKILAFCLSLLMVMMAFSGCNNSPGELSEAASSNLASSASTKKSGITIGCSMAVMTSPFYGAIKQGMDGVLKEGDTLNCVDAKLDGAKQLNDVEDMIQQGVDMILLDPVDSKGVKSALESAKNAGIPVIVFNNAAEEGKELVASTIVSDNYMAGKLAAQAIAKAIGDKGEVAILDYNIVTTAKLRADGFVDEIKANYPNIKIVNRQEMSAASTDVALPIMENILQATPKISAVFAINDPSAIGAIAAIESAGKQNDIIVCGVDGSDDAKDMIRKGKMFATSAQFPKLIGEACIESTYKHLTGESVEAEQMIKVAVIDKSNVDKE